MQNISLTGNENKKKSLIYKQLTELLTMKYFKKFNYYQIF